MEYDTVTQIYTRVTDVQWSRWLNGWSVHNTGNTNLFVNNDMIPPGASKTVGGNFGEIFKGRIELMFRLPTPAPVTPNNEVTVTQKFYLIPDE